MKNMRKKSLAVIAGLVMTGLVGASAASLGGITSDTLGADTEVVAACDTVNGLTVDYVAAYNAVAEMVAVTAVVVGDVDAACAGLPYEVTLTGDGPGAGAPRSVLGTSLPGNATSPSFSPTFNPLVPINAELVTGIVITISG